MTNGIAVVAGVAGMMVAGTVLLLLVCRDRGWGDRWVRLSYLAFLSSLVVFLTCFGLVADVQLTAPIIVMGACPLFIAAYVIHKMPHDAPIKRELWHLRVSGAAAGVVMACSGLLLRVNLNESGFGPLALIGFGVLVVFLSLTATSTRKRQTAVA